MNEMMQDECCLESQTQGCCEGWRRPFSERKMQSHYYLNAPGPSCTTPEDWEIEVSINDEVSEVIQEREAVYGPPSVNLDCIARHWQAYLDNRNSGPLTLQDVCNMMCLAKISRMARTPEHADSVKDIKAYRQIAESVK